MTSEPQIVQNVIAIGGFAYGAVYGDLHVHGDGRPVYTIEAHRPGAAPPVEWLLQLPSRMLDAKHGIVEFAGRDAELAALARWRDDSARLGVMYVHAPGGQGKTRLAAHFAELSVADGWKVLTARHGGDTVTAPDGSQDLGPGDAKGLLLIVDYADRWPHSHLEWLLRNRLLHTPVQTRVLLLARSAHAWPALQHALEEVYAATSDLALRPLGGDHQDRVTLFGKARDRFGELFGLPAGTVVLAPTTLDDASFQLVLALHMAALVAVDACARGEPAPADPSRLTAYLLRREHAHWARLFSRKEHGLDFETPPEVMAQAAFTATFTGTMAVDRADAVLAEVAPSWPVPATRIRADHLVCYPANEVGMALEPLYPDRLAEDFLALSLPGHPVTGYQADPWTADAMSRLLTQSPQPIVPGVPVGRVVSGVPVASGVPVVSVAPRAVTFLAAAAERWPHVSAGHLFPILRRHPEIALAAGGLALTAVAELPDIDMGVLEAVEPLLPPERHVDFDIAAVTVVERLTRHRLATVTDPARRAHLLDQLVRRLSNVGRWDQMRAVTGEMVAIYRGLHDHAPGSVDVEFAQALHSQSLALSFLGQQDEALDSLTQAVQVRERLTRLDPAQHGPDLGLSLTMLGSQLGNLERREEALAAAQRAYEIWRDLSERDKRLQPNLAKALDGWGERLFGLGRWQDALTAAEASVILYRAHAQAEPAKFEPDLASALSTHATALSATGDNHAALAATQESVEILRRLAQVSPLAFERDLAQSLETLGHTQQRMGSRVEALQTRQESLELRRRLAGVHPAAFSQVLANSLANLASALFELGRREEAMTAAEESIAIYRKLMAQAPAVHAPAFAGVLNISAAILLSQGSRDRALAETLEAVQIRRRLAEDNVEAHQVELSVSLNGLGLRLAEAGRHPEALLASQEALSIVDRLAVTQPESFLPQVASALINLSLALERIGLPDEAAVAADRCVTISRALAQANPDFHGPTLASALNNLAVNLSHLGRAGEAATAMLETVEIHRRLAGAHRARFEPDLAKSLANLGDMLSNVDRPADALAALEESVEVWRRQDIVTEGMPHALVNLGVVLAANGRSDDAVSALAEGVDILERLCLTDPIVMQPRLARALNDLCAVLAELGNTGEYQRRMNQHLELLEQLFARDEPTHLAAFAEALTRLGHHQAMAGQFLEALASTERAVALLRRVADPRQPESLTSLANALTNLAAVSANLGHAQESIGRLAVALTAEQESAQIRQTLADDQPGLATSLLTVAQLQGHLGRHEEALAPGMQSVDIWRDLSRADPAAYDAHLANALAMVIAVLSNLGRIDEALTATVESIAIQRRLAGTQPDVYVVPAAMSAFQLSQLLAGSGRWPQARTAAQEAAEAWRQIVAISPAHEPYLAHCLVGLGDALAHTANHPDAVIAFTEAAEIQRRLAHDEPGLATTLHMLCECFNELELSAEFITAGRECVAIRRRLAVVHPTAVPTLIMSLVSLASVLAVSGANPEALEMSGEAVDLARALSPGSATADFTLASAQSGFAAVRVQSKQDLSSALRAAQAAVALFQALAERTSPAFQEPLDDAVSTLAQVQVLLGADAGTERIVPPPAPTRQPWWRRLWPFRR